MHKPAEPAEADEANELVRFFCSFTGSSVQCIADDGTNHYLSSNHPELGSVPASPESLEWYTKHTTSYRELHPNKLLTVLAFLETLPDGYRERALAQVDEVGAGVGHLVCTMAQAINALNDWDTTDEGCGFWEEVEGAYSTNPETPDLPPLPVEAETTCYCPPHDCCEVCYVPDRSPTHFIPPLSQTLPAGITRVGNLLFADIDWEYSGLVKPTIHTGYPNKLYCELGTRIEINGKAYRVCGYRYYDIHHPFPHECVTSWICTHEAYAKYAVLKPIEVAR